MATLGWNPPAAGRNRGSARVICDLQQTLIRWEMCAASATNSLLQSAKPISTPTPILRNPAAYPRSGPCKRSSKFRLGPETCISAYAARS